LTEEIKALSVSIVKKGDGKSCKAGCVKKLVKAGRTYCFFNFQRCRQREGTVLKRYTDEPMGIEMHHFH
jgi:hypothetical protein